MYRRKNRRRDRREGEDSPVGKFPLVNNIRICYNYEWAAGGPLPPLRFSSGSKQQNSPHRPISPTWKVDMARGRAPARAPEPHVHLRLCSCSLRGRTETALLPARASSSRRESANSAWPRGRRGPWAMRVPTAMQLPGDLQTQHPRANGIAAGLVRRLVRQLVIYNRPAAQVNKHRRDATRVPRVGGTKRGLSLGVARRQSLD